jgi:CMP/dCMP kinase
VVAIDGPSGSGKTTMARLVAEEMGYDYLDTGALYRAIAMALRKEGVEPEDEDERLRSVLRKTSVTFSEGRVYLNGTDVSETIRSSEIDHYSSVFSARQIVREFLLDAQREAALEREVVVEGRDTTTVVFPDAQKKIFLDASVEERARRRFDQYRAKGIATDLGELKKKILERDKRDAGRPIAPLKKSENAYFIDTSELTVEEVKQKIVDFVRKDA